ncbi:MAG: class I SAM-dependent methyltransferase [Polyangiaceae bacterium]
MIVVSEAWTMTPAMTDIRDLQLHLDRGRAESFGSVAAEYDRFRSPFPEPLIADLAENKPNYALDVASGTGRIPRQLAAHGVRALGVELDARMAQVARAHGVEVEVSRFEEWDDRGRTFDLVTVADAWHWIEPKAGIAKIGKVLRPGGTLARFFNTHKVPENLLAGFESIYAKLAPNVMVHGKLPDTIEWKDPLEDSPLFTHHEKRIYEWERSFDADSWLGLTRTVSDHQRMDPAEREKLFEMLRGAITFLGGRFVAKGKTFALFANRSGE